MTNGTLASTIPLVLNELVDALNAAGLPATRDPQAFQPPGAIIVAPTIRDATMGGVLELEVPIYVVTPDTGQSGLDELLAMVDVVRATLGVVPAETAVWTSPLNPAGLPAYRIPLSATAQAVDVAAEME